jgi:hypothetical protein
MAHTIESIASTRKKTKEVSRTEALLPGDLREKSARLVELLQDYYTHLNEKGEPSYALNSINNQRDIDEMDSEYLSLIQREIAVTIPKSIITDKVRLYKNLVRYYSLRGSQDSIELFFKILFNDTVELYYPYKDVLIPSSGKWQPSLGAFADNTGFLSDTIKLQDSYFYQKFSYVIRTGNNVSTWRDVYNRLVHPAGFIFFGEILILLEATNDSGQVGKVLKVGSAQNDDGTFTQFMVASVMPYTQPGYIGLEDIPVLVLIELLNSLEASVAEMVYRINLQVPTGTPGTDMAHFWDSSANGAYSQVTIENAETSSGSALMYSWGDYTIDDLINNQLYWNDVELGVIYY